MYCIEGIGPLKAAASMLQSICLTPAKAAALATCAMKAHFFLPRLSSTTTITVLMPPWLPFVVKPQQHDFPHATMALIYTQQQQHHGLPMPCWLMGLA